MKKIVGLLFALSYLITSSSLVHASTMGILTMPNHSTHTVSHCHEDTKTSSTSDKQTHNMNCCELFNSSKYSQAKLEFTTSIKYIPLHISQESFNRPRLSTLQTFDLRPNFSPGSQTSHGKYLRFSDLSAGIIVSLS